MNPAGVVLITAQEEFEFPLAEASRKQLFSRAQQLAQQGLKVRLIVVTPDQNRKLVQEQIPIILCTRRKLISYMRLIRSHQTLEYWGSTGAIAALVAMIARGRRRVLVFTDGGLFAHGPGEAKRRWLAEILSRSFDEVRLFTDYQKKKLLQVSSRYEGKIIKIKPILRQGLSPLSDERKRKPVILYMGHLSRFKGVDLLIKLFEQLLPELPALQLVLCQNDLVYDHECVELVQAKVRAYPNNLILKGRVNPYQELAKAQLLIHPIRRHSGTFAFPMTLWEGLVCETPFLSTNLDGFREFFDDYFLCPPGDYEQLYSRARRLLLNPEEARQRLKRNRENLAPRLDWVTYPSDQPARQAACEQERQRC